MGVAIFPRKWTEAPRGPVTINWSHPLAEGLVAVVIARDAGPLELLTNTHPFQAFAGSGHPVGAANGAYGALMGNTGIYTWTFPNSGTNYGPWISGRSDGMTCFARMTHYAAPDVNATLFGVSYANGVISPYLSCAVEISGNVVAGSVNASGTLQRTSSSSAPIVGMAQTYSFHGGPLGNRLMRNGVVLVDNTTASGPITFSNGWIFLGDPFGLSRFANAVLDVGYIWGGPDKGKQVEWLHAEPYALLQPVRGLRVGRGSAAASGSSLFMTFPSAG